MWSRRALARPAVWLILLAACSLPSGAPLAAELEQLETRVREQEEVIEQQERRIQAQERRLTELEGRIGAVDEAGSDMPTAPVHSGGRWIRLAISGQVHRTLNVVADGDETDAYHVDNDASNTRLRVNGEGEISDDLSLVARIEVALSANNSGQVSQDNQAAGDTGEIRIGEIYLESRAYGRLSVGRGFSASDSSAEVDLSRTSVVAYSGFSNPMGGIRFFDDATGTRSGVTLNRAFGNRDGLGRENRVVYETPTLRGFQLAAGANTNGRYDAAIRWAGRGHGVRAAGAFAYADFGGADPQQYRLSGSLSIVHETTGLNLTFASGMDDRKNMSDVIHLYGKLGWLAEFFQLGTTAFAIDYGRSVNLPTAQDQGHSAGVVVVQHFNGWGSEIYTQYRWFELNREGADFADVHAGSVGVRVKF